MRHLCKVAALASVLFVAGSLQSAHALVFNLNTVFTGATPSGPAPWATITINDFAANEVELTIALSAGLSSTEFISDIWLNLNPFVPVSMVGGSFSGPAAAPSVTTNQDNLNGGAGHKFDLNLGFQNSAGSGRLQAGETVMFRLTGSSLDANDFFALSHDNALYVSAHVQGIPTGAGSGHITTPEPASMIALGTGLLGILGLRRRNKK